ncbi:MAG: putative metal-binding motif-containing protein [bacterium]
MRAGDCNDDDAATNPGAVEVYDGIDNDCDGNVDEGFDLDADGYTICAGDCDDNDDTVYPGAPGTHRGKDNNCNGIIDPDEKGRSIYPVYIPMLSSGLQYQQLRSLSFLPVYMDQQRRSWYEYQYTFFQQQWIKTIPVRHQSWFSIIQPYWYNSYLPWYVGGN